jgi:hypothetical protein
MTYIVFAINEPGKKRGLKKNSRGKGKNILKRLLQICENLDRSQKISEKINIFSKMQF